MRDVGASDQRRVDCRHGRTSRSAPRAARTPRASDDPFAPRHVVDLAGRCRARAAGGRPAPRPARRADRAPGPGCPSARVAAPDARATRSRSAKAGTTYSGLWPGPGVGKRPGDHDAEAGPAPDLERRHLRAHLAGRVGRDRPQRVGLDPGRRRRRRRRPRPVDTSRTTGSRPAGLAQRLGGGDEPGGAGGVDLPGRAGILPRLAHGGDGGQVHHRLGRPTRARRGSTPSSVTSSGSTAPHPRAPAPSRPPGPPGRHAGRDLVARPEQVPHQVPSDEAVGPGDQHLHGRPVIAARAPGQRRRGASRSRSASTIIATSSAKPTFGVQPSSRRAFDGSASSRSTSAGR